MRDCPPFVAAAGESAGALSCCPRSRFVDRWAGCRPRGAVLAIALAACLPATGRGESFYHENVLGTSLELHVDSPSLETDRQAEAAVLAELDRLSRILSTYSDASEFRRLLDGEKTPRAASPELVEVLRACDHWKAVSGGAFNPAAEVFGRLWGRCADENRLPSPGELADAVRRVQQPLWEIDPRRATITRRADLPLSLNALAKGYLIDRACRAALAGTPGVTGLVLNIGGDLRVDGDVDRVIGIADPWAPVENAPPLCYVQIRRGAVATSGNYERGFAIGGTHYSHIIDPRTGKPVERIVSATVIAPEAAQADALATILNVLEPSEGAALVDRLDDTECLIVTRDGRLQQSAGWAQRVIPEAELRASAEGGLAEPGQDATGVSASFVRFQEPAEGAEPGAAGAEGEPPADSPEPFPWGHENEVVVELQLRPGGGWHYARPYVAVWIEDAEGKPLRTLALWGRDYRWLPYLRRWYYFHGRDRRLVYAVSRASRPPGRYRIVWDGRANDGRYVPTGRYIVNIEASREHGTYQLTRQMIEIGSEPFAFDTKGNYEVPRASIEYRPKKSPEQQRRGPGT